MNRQQRRDMKKDPILSHEYISGIMKRFYMIGAEQMFYTIIATLKETKGIGPKTMARIFEELERVHPKKEKEVQSGVNLEKGNDQNGTIRSV